MNAPRQARESLYFDVVTHMLQRSKTHRLPEQELVNAGIAILKVGKVTVKEYLDIMCHAPSIPVTKDGSTVVLDTPRLKRRPERYRQGKVLSRDITIPTTPTLPPSQSILTGYI